MTFIADGIFAAPALSQARAEQGIMLNRVFLTFAVLVAAALHARVGGRDAQDFFSQGLSGLIAYVALSSLIQAHLALRPRPGAVRRTVSICADAAFISFGLWQGGSASAFLFPLYLWMILGNGVRLGSSYMGVSVACAALGFATTVWLTSFWRDNAALSAGLFCALITIPAYGALLLRRLDEARAEAERANRAKTHLLANVSHELRTPLTAILGLGDLLEKTGLDAAQRDMVRTISGAGRALLRHIEALLAVSRDEIGGDRPRPERVDLHALLMSLRAMLAVEADRKGVRLGLSIDARAPRHIKAEPGLLLDILQNLGGNAVKFTEAGAVAIHVAAARRGGDMVLRVEVRDTGIGVDRAAQERIFETFAQAGPEIASRYGGSGLGLAIARRRLQARGGRIGVESEPGKGALFWFELAVASDDAAPCAPAGDLPPPLRLDGGDGPQTPGPVGAVAPAPFDILALARRFAVAVVAREGVPEEVFRAQEIAASLRALSGEAVAARGGEADAGTAAPHASGRTILLAEDNGVNRMIFEAILANGGYRVTSVADGEAALAAMLSETFDLILLDLNMPKIDGLEAARLYRFGMAGATRAPVVALTADATPQRREACEEAGMAACLIKPIAPEALLAALDEAFAAGGGGRAAKSPERPAERPAAAAPVEEKSLDALAALGGEEFVQTVIMQFIGESAQNLERIVQAVEQGDQEAFRSEAHALESSAGNVGALALARLCRERRGTSARAFALHGEDYLDDLRREWSRAAAALNGHLARRRPRRNETGDRDEAA